MRSQAIREREDADQVMRHLQNASVSQLTLAQAKAIVSVQGCPISTDIQTALTILTNQERIRLLGGPELIKESPDELLEISIEA